LDLKLIAYGLSSTVGNDADNVSSMQKSKAKNDADARQSVPHSASPQRFTTTNLVNPVAATSDSGING